jgi:PAS domain S-box-containing protein
MNGNAAELLARRGCTDLGKLTVSSAERLLTAGGRPKVMPRSDGSSAGCGLESQIYCRLPDGSTIFLTRVWGESSNTVLVVEDATEAMQQARHQRLAALIFRHMRAAPDIHRALDSILRALSLFTGWRRGEVWMAKKGSFALRAARHDGQPLTSMSVKDCPDPVSAAWESGLVQRARSSGVPTGEAGSRRKGGAGENPAEVVSVPLRTESGVQAVLHFEIERAKSSDTLSIDLLARVSADIAIELERRMESEQAYAAQRQLDDILLTAGDAIILLDAGHRIRLFNRQAEKIFGHEASEVVGKHLEVLLPEAARDIHARHLASFGNMNDAARFMGGRPEIRGRRKDGSEFPAEASVSRTLIDGEAVYTAVVRDLTTIKAAEAALVASEEKMRTIVQAMPVGLAICDAAGGTIAFANRSFSALVGAEPNELVGREVAEFIELSDEDLQTGALSGVELPIRATSGAIRWCMTAALELSVSGSDVLLLGCYDVTDRREAAEALRISAHNLAEAERIAHLGNWRWHVSRNELDWSVETRRIFGLPEDGTPGCYENFLSYVHESDRARVDSSIRQALVDSDAYCQSFDIVLDDQTVRHVQLQAEIARDNDGCPMGMMGTVQDITEINRVREELQAARILAEAADRTKSQFLANMSHELRTPLNAIIGFSELMALDVLGPMEAGQYREYARDINESGRILLGIVDDILSLSSIEIGDLQLQEDECDIVAVIDAALERLSGRARRREIDIRRNAQPGLPLLFGDERLLRQTVRSLLSNAIKFTPEGGTVSIAARLDDNGALQLEFQDSGIGIPAAEIERILQPIVQVDNRNIQRSDGAGLGLTLTSEYVRLHGATLAISSEVDAGTKVIVTFPPSRTCIVSRRLDPPETLPLSSSAGRR